VNDENLRRQEESVKKQEALRKSMANIHCKILMQE
jgi:hypothetical protein